MKQLLTIAALATAGFAVPASAATIDLSTGGQWNGQPGYFTTNQTFALPLNAINVALRLTVFSVDDRGILTLNGTQVAAVGIGAATNPVGVFNFSQGAPAVAQTYTVGGARDTTVTTGFVLGGINNFTFQGNDTNGGIRGNLLTTAVNTSYNYTANVTYDVAAVPEPTIWAMMVVGFGIAAGSLRRRRTNVSFA